MIPLVRAGGFKHYFVSVFDRKGGIPLVRAGGFKLGSLPTTLPTLLIPLVRAGGFKHRFGCGHGHADHDPARKSGWI